MLLHFEENLTFTINDVKLGKWADSRISGFLRITLFQDLSLYAMVDLWRRYVREKIAGYAQAFGMKNDIAWFVKGGLRLSGLAM